MVESAAERPSDQLADGTVATSEASMRGHSTCDQGSPQSPDRTSPVAHGYDQREPASTRMALVFEAIGKVAGLAMLSQSKKLALRRLLLAWYFARSDQRSAYPNCCRNCSANSLVVEALVLRAEVLDLQRAHQEAMRPVVAMSMPFIEAEDQAGAVGVAAAGRVDDAASRCAAGMCSMPALVWTSEPLRAAGDDVGLARARRCPSRSSRSCPAAGWTRSR